MRVIKVLIADGSALIREMLMRGLSLEPSIEVVGTCGEVNRLLDMILDTKPQVIILDPNLSRMNAADFILTLMSRHPLSIILTTQLKERDRKKLSDLLRNAIIAFVEKPVVDISQGMRKVVEDLRKRVKTAALADLGKWRKKQKKASSAAKVRYTVKEHLAFNKKLIAIGASAGGPEALRKFLRAFPAKFPGMLIVQHMPEDFIKSFVDSLNGVTAMTVVEGKTGDRVEEGKIIVAPGHSHMELYRSGEGYFVRCYAGNKVCGHRPAVEVLFRSVAQYAGPKAVGVMLTGMGNDGANAMAMLRKSGARTVAQNKESCAVFGMPKEAWRMGGVEKLADLSAIPEIIEQYLREIRRK